MSDINTTSNILPATTEIPLNNGDYDVTNNDIHTNGGQHGTERDIQTESPDENKMNPNPPQKTGGQTYVGSSSVGSRLAGEDFVGSRLASSGITAKTQSRTDPNQSPVYNPNATLNLGKSSSQSKLGFGHTPTSASNASKLSSLTLQEVQQVASVKAENIKSWSVKTYRCTKQILSEKLGRGSKTVDLELEAKIEILRDTKRKYENLLMLTKVLANHFSSIIQTQKVLSAAFGELSSKSQELQEEFRYNAETQLVVAKNGENLLAAINFFSSGVTTLCTKTMEDSLLTVNRYESARVTFDAYRNDLETLNLAPRTESNILKQANAQAMFNTNRTAYEKLRDDVGVKLQFLDENRVKVMQKHLLLFHNAITAYFAGNQQQLEATLQQFNIAPTSNSTSSWLEKE